MNEAFWAAVLVERNTGGRGGIPDRGRPITPFFGPYAGPVTGDWLPRLRSLFEAASPAVLTTHRADGSAVTSPGETQGRQFAQARRNKPGVLVRLIPIDPKVWDLAHILPS